MEPRARRADEREIYFLLFFVVFLDDFLVVDFLPFLAAMALVTSFLAVECKVRQISRQRFFACVKIFFRAVARAIFARGARSRDRFSAPRVDLRARARVCRRACARVARV